MTQRIFDIYNEKDYADLWDIVPDKVYLITRGICDSDIMLWYRTPKGKTSSDCYHGDFLKINWHDKTEITRPVNYEKMIGCVGWFWDVTEANKIIGILTRYDEKRESDPFLRSDAAHYCHFRPAKKSELKFWEEKNE